MHAVDDTTLDATTSLGVTKLTILANATPGLCHSLDDMNDNHVDGTPMNDISVESLMSSLWMTLLLNRWCHLSRWHPYGWHLCWIADDIPMNDTSVKSLMSSLGMKYLWVTPCWIVEGISRDDIPINDTFVESFMSSLGMTYLWMTPLLNRSFHRSGWNTYKWYLCWIVDVIPRDEISMKDASVESLMTSLWRWHTYE